MLNLHIEDNMAASSISSFDGAFITKLNGSIENQ